MASARARIVALSRLELFSKLGRIQVVEPMLREAHLARQRAEWETEGVDHHGQNWRLSLRGSQFPGDDPRACARQFVYWLMGTPEVEPTSPDVHGTAIVGQAVEADDIAALDFAGRVLSVPALLPKGAPHLGFEDADHWLTVTPDIVVLPRGWNRPHCLEEKTKDGQVVVDMQNGTCSYDPKHRNQLLASMALLNALTQELWPSVWVCRESWRLGMPMRDEETGRIARHFCAAHESLSDEDPTCLREIKLESCRTGSLVYHSRERPNKVRKEWFFELDPNFMETGRAVLRDVIDHFKRGELPPHPFGGKGWSELPCKWCKFKREACRKDEKAGITRIDKSHAIEFARSVRPGYSFADQEKAVLERWRGKSGIYYRREESERSETHAHV